MKSFLLCALSVSSVLVAQDFEADIRPLAAGALRRVPWRKKNKADLRLDAKMHAFKGGESGPAIVAGKSDDSLIFQRLTSADEDERMPPKGKALSAAQIAKIKAWIDEGAEWPETAADKAAAEDQRLSHWAYQPLQRSTNARNVDEFISSKLAENHLSLSKAADARTLIRRV